MGTMNLLAQLQERFTDALSGLVTNSDRLPALAGMASTWTSLGFGKYLAGLWAKDVLRDLMWMNFQRVSAPKFAPSWSWVSTRWSSAACSTPTIRRR